METRLKWTGEAWRDLREDKGFFIFIYISYFKHIYTGYKFNKDIVLQFGPVKIKVPNKLFTNKLIDKNKYIWRQ